MKRIFLFILVLTLTITLCSCGSDEVPKKPTIAVGIVPQSVFVDKVANGLVNVVTLIPPGNSPANYQPTARGMQAFSEAAIYFTLRMPTEEANILPKAPGFNKTLKIIDLHEAVGEVYPFLYGSHDKSNNSPAQSAHEHVTADPHLWLSPKRVIVMVERIAEELSVFDKSNAEIYKNNARVYIEELKSLDNELSALFKQQVNKEFIIYHGSYRYFADDYGLKMTSIEIDGKQATAVEIRKVIESARSNNIKVIFYQDEFDDNQARTVAEEIGGIVMKASPLSYDYINSLRDFAYAVAGMETPNE